MIQTSLILLSDTNTNDIVSSDYLSIIIISLHTAMWFHVSLIIFKEWKGTLQSLELENWCHTIRCILMLYPEHPFWGGVLPLNRDTVVKFKASLIGLVSCRWKLALSKGFIVYPVSGEITAEIDKRHYWRRAFRRIESFEWISVKKINKWK